MARRTRTASRMFVKDLVRTARISGTEVPPMLERGPDTEEAYPGKFGDPMPLKVSAEVLAAVRFAR